MLTPRPLPPLLSIVIPMYNEEAAFPYLRAELSRVRADFGCPTEIVLVDDGSSDGTVACMRAWSAEDKSIKSVVLSRNFGHQVAVSAGLDVSRGDAVVIMDADLQDPPAVAVEMMRGYCLGYDVVYGQRIKRQDDTWFKRITARLFYRLMRQFVDKRLPPNVGDFRLISRRVVNDLKRMPERDRFLRGMVAWVGYAQLAQPYDRPRRVAGATKYPFWKMIRFALTAIVAFSDLPLRLVTWGGFASLALSLVLIIRILFLYFATNTPLVLGYPSLVIMIAFFSGMIMVSIGVLGLYVGKIFAESQGRPLYLVESAMNVDDPGSR